MYSSNNRIKCTSFKSGFRKQLPSGVIFINLITITDGIMQTLHSRKKKKWRGKYTKPSSFDVQ